MHNTAEICFSLALRGKSNITAEVDNEGDAEVNVSVTPKEVIQLMYDCLDDPDMLTEENVNQIQELRGEIAQFLNMRTAECRCASCSNPRSCVDCENFAKICGQV